jgi:thioredoxin 1
MGLRTAGCDSGRVPGTNARVDRPTKVMTAMGQGITEFTDNNFQTEVLESNQPVLVDFWAPWCGPCLRLAPTIEELATEFAGRVRVGKLNTDDNNKTPTQYNIQGIPTVILFKDGEPVDRQVGLVPKEKLVSLLNKHA